MEIKDFKIIAIRPLAGCNKKHLKILHPGTVYRFYNNYKFTKANETNTNSKVTKIEVDKVLLPDLYNIKREYGDDLNVNISAILIPSNVSEGTLRPTV